MHRQGGKMSRLAIFCAVLCLGLALLGCDRTEIDNNPVPIVWGGISFFPKSVEKSRDKTVYNNITFAGYGKKGTIDRVTVTRDEAQVENLVSDFYSSKKQIWQGASGEYKEALEFLMSDAYKQAYQSRSFTSMPKFSIASYKGEGDSWTTDDGRAISESVSVKNLHFIGQTDYEAKNVALKEKDSPDVRIASISLAKLELPEDVDAHPEKILLNDLQLNDLSIAQFDAKVKSIRLDYNDYKLKFGIDQASVPGKVLALLGVPNAPDMLEGSLNGQGQVRGQKFTADASLDLTGLLDATADITGSLTASKPDKLSFTLKDTGVLNYINNEMKGQLALMALFVPNGQAALLSFLAKPGQTLSGSISFKGGAPEFDFSVQ